MRRIRVISRCHGISPTVRPLPPPPLRPLLSTSSPTPSSSAACAGTFSSGARSGELRPLTHRHHAQVPRLSSTPVQQRSLSPLPSSKSFPRQFPRGGHDSAPSSVVCGGSSGPIALNTRSTSSQEKETPSRHESPVTSATSSSVCSENDVYHQRDSISDEAHLVLNKSRGRSSSRMTPSDLSVPDDMSLGERRRVVERLLEEHDWEGTVRALGELMAVPSLVSQPEGQKVRSLICRYLAPVREQVTVLQLMLLVRIRSLPYPHKAVCLSGALYEYGHVEVAREPGERTA